ncbi:MAG: DNA-processing protein DprA [Pseudomonadota bacterium]
MQARLKLAPPRSEPAPAPPAPDPVAALRLARSRNVGPATWLRLVQRFGAPDRALEALPDLARRGGAREVGICSLSQAEREIERGRAAGARLLVLGAPGYPSPLARIPDPPPVLWLRGAPDAFARPAAALVGGRNASALGLRLAEALGRDLAAAGWCVVSGMARGVDGAAHGGALSVESEAGPTLAVLAGGVDQVYPAEHAALADRIAEQGVLLSEAPPGLEPQARHFPRRNRIVAGLSRGVVVVEAAERSGSLITARFALEQGREVMAVPGAPLDPRSAGGNALIRDGAVLVRSAEDVIEALSPSLDPDVVDGQETAPPRADLLGQGLAEPSIVFDRPSPPQVDAAARARIAELLGLQPVEEDVLARLSGAPLAAVAEALMELELAGRLDRRPGGFLALLPD